MQLHVRVIEARDIAKMDLFSKTDAYCLLNIVGKGHPKKTSVKQNNMTPRWDEEFHFPISNPQSDILHIFMKDEDVISDDPMATLDISLITLTPGVVVDQWYDMKPVKGVKKGGRLHLLLHLASTGAPPFVNSMTFTNAFAGFGNNMMGLANVIFTPTSLNQVYQPPPQMYVPQVGMPRPYSGAVPAPYPGALPSTRPSYPNYPQPQFAQYPPPQNQQYPPPQNPQYPPPQNPQYPPPQNPQYPPQQNQQYQPQSQGTFYPPPQNQQYPPQQNQQYQPQSQGTFYPPPSSPYENPYA